MASNADRPHGDAALAEALEPRPKRFGIGSFSIRAKPKREPHVAPPPRTPRVRPVRVVDAVVATLGKNHGGIRPPAAPGHVVPSVGPVAVTTIEQPHGAEAILRYLKRKGTTIALSPDRAYLVPTSKAGRMLGPERDLLTVAGPLLLAYLRGEPLQCAVRATHAKGTDPTAVTLLVGGCPACASCLSA